MDFIYLILFVIVISIIVNIVKSISRTPEEKLKDQQEAAEKFNIWAGLGVNYPEIICPHCQVKGNVRIQPVKYKKGISGGKATAALLTGGVSLLATGLSRKVAGSQAHCDNCKMTWTI